MKMKAFFIAFLVLLSVASYYLWGVMQEKDALHSDEMKVILAYNPEYRRAAPHIQAAYESVLQEEGVPFASIDVFQLLHAAPEELLPRMPVLLLPDQLLQNVPGQFGIWIKDYVKKGGRVLLVYDPGVRHQQKFFLKQAVFADLLGWNYMAFERFGEAAYEQGRVRFASTEKRDFFQIPPGKTEAGLFLSGYSYGVLQYPMARGEALPKFAPETVYAYGSLDGGEEVPVLYECVYGEGQVLYANLPLGHLKAQGDDLLLRAVLRTFLFDMAEMPHVLNVENGRGGMVLNWHVDSNADYLSLPQMEQKGLLRPGIGCSFAVAAGDYNLNPGDGLGFDVEGKGRQFLPLMLRYGNIGSHGGWAHNWFALSLEQGLLGEQEIKYYIQKNMEALEKAGTGKIREYAAPVGVHPQPVTTKALEELGVEAYYYTGDTGSGPNRTFLNGKMVSNKVIAFPVMPNGKAASLWEMREEGKSSVQIRQWLLGIADYAARQRVVRLFYSHPHDVLNEESAVKDFFDHLEELQKKQQLMIEPMIQASEFFLRFLETKCSFRLTGDSLAVDLRNPQGLEGICVAIPRAGYVLPQGEGWRVETAERYYFATVEGKNEKEKTLVVPKR